jgi:hypothetical protein
MNVIGEEAKNTNEKFRFFKKKWADGCKYKRSYILPSAFKNFNES